MQPRLSVPVRFGDVELLVEAVPVPGSEPTSRVTRAVEGVDVVGSGTRSSTWPSRRPARSRTPRRRRRVSTTSRWLGVKVSAPGNVIVAGPTAEPTLRVKLVYDAEPGPTGCALLAHTFRPTSAG